MFVNRIKPKVLFKRFIEECVDIGLRSVALIVLTSTFIGIVCCYQTNNSMMAWIPKSTIALSLKNMVILELAATLTAIIFAGKNGSLMANEISSMKISEQIDAINVMGLNSRAYLGFPKILASVTMYPLLVIISASVALFMGYLFAVNFLGISSEDFISGYQMGKYHVGYMLTKSVVFGFLISSISVFCGFYLEGNGETVIVQASKNAFVTSCAFVLIFDFVISQLIL